MDSGRPDRRGLAAGHGDKRPPDGRRLSAADDEWASSGRLAVSPRRRPQQCVSICNSKTDPSSSTDGVASVAIEATTFSGGRHSWRPATARWPAPRRVQRHQRIAPTLLSYWTARQRQPTLRGWLIGTGTILCSTTSICTAELLT